MLVLPSPSRGHTSVLMQLQQSDPIFSMVVDVMRPEFNFKPKYKVTMLPREELTRGTETLPVVKGFIWFKVGSRMKKGTGAGVYQQSVERRLIISLGRYATVFHAAIYAILACAYEIQLYGRPEKYVIIRSDSQAALKALRPPEQHLHWYNSAKRR